MIHVTAHAIERARRRLGCSTDAEAIGRLSAPSIEAAANAGATAVILPSGHKVILAGRSVVTVKPKSNHKRRVQNVGGKTRRLPSAISTPTERIAR